MYFVYGYDTDFYKYKIKVEQLTPFKHLSVETGCAIYLKLNPH